MSAPFYRLVIRGYGLLIRIASLFSDKARKWVAGRKGLFEELEGEKQRMEHEKERWIWIHASSLGEFEQVRPILERIREERKGIGTCLTFFSPSGYEARRGKGDADIVTYMPLDTRSNARRFVEILRPDLALFVKYELWYEHLKVLKEEGVEQLLLAAVFRPDHRYFRWYGGFFRRMLKSFDGIHVQGTRSKELLEGIGIEGVQVSGDPRYDRTWRIASEAEALPMVETFKNGAFLLIGGSSWPPEEKLLNAYLRIAPKELKLLLAPHDVKENHIQGIEKRFSEYDTVRYSEDPDEEALRKARILIIDRIGLLARIYRYGDAALVGGGFSGALHNVLEPAAHGVPVLFGPDVTAFPEAVDLIVHEAGHSVTSAKELEACISEWIEDPVRSQRSKENAKVFVKKRKGASEEIFRDIKGRLKET